MDKIFAEMFAKEPDEIINGDYFYHLSYHKEWMAELNKLVGVSLEEQDKRTKSVTEHFFCDRFPNITLQGKVHGYHDERWVENIKGKNKDIKIAEIFNQIIFGNKPFMEIASGSGMGITPYIIKMNPKIPCLVTDITTSVIKYLRLFINKNSTEYNVNFASFDNLDMPLKNESLEYITSYQGITSSVGKPAEKSYRYPANKEKSIAEVYRVLKPGGYFITLESNEECDYDLQKLFSNYNQRGKLFGIYSYDEIQAVLSLFIEEPWRDKFVSAGFHIEFEKKYPSSYSLRDVMNFLHNFTNYHGIRRWEKINWEEQRRAENFVWDFNKDELENVGMDLYHVDTFFVLRKPCNQKR